MILNKAQAEAVRDAMKLEPQKALAVARALRKLLTQTPFTLNAIPKVPTRISGEKT